ncbi:MAG: inovirus Gp2 family protein, partial [Alcaligenaceae bacterium]
NREGVNLLRAVTQQLSLIEELLPCNAFNPYVELLRAQLKVRPHIRDLPVRIGALVADEAEEVFGSLDSFVKDLRVAAHSKAFQREIANRRRQMQKNHLKGTRYIEKCFKKRSRLLVIRIDLVVGGEHSESRGITHTVDLKQARTEFAKWLRYTRATYPRVGHLHELEYGLLSGYHFHVLLLLDGHLECADVRIAQKLGQHWDTVITEGRGRHWNCNARAFAYERPALGMIKRQDSLKRIVLIEKVLDYLTRKRFWMRLEGIRKTFGTGQDPGKRTRRQAA